MAGLGHAFDYITNDATGLPYKWPAGTVAIQIKLGSATSLSDGLNYSTSAQGAAQLWNNQMGNLQITSQIAPAGSATDHDRVNELVFDSTVFGKAFDTNVIAVTTTWVSGNTRTEGDIIFNSARTWDSYDGNLRSSLDLQRVALHELGHMLGLDHPDDASQNVSAVMNSRISNLDTLTSDDITGVQNLYGPPGVPGNDNFANATILTLTNNAAKVSGYNTNATKQTGEPNHAGNVGGHSVWWKWTAPSNGNVTIDTRGSYSDTTLGIYTGTAVGSLTTIASNDDLQNDQNGHVQASSVSFNATGGTTYFIAVDGFNTESSGLTVNLAFTSTGPAVPVITSQPVNATVTTGGSVTFTVTATGAVSYQWFFNNAVISGATNASYNLGNVTAGSAGPYYVAVTNAAGTVNSEIVTLLVTTPPAPPPPPTSGGGGGGGGGGAPSLWFYALLGALALGRRLWRRY